MRRSSGSSAPWLDGSSRPARASAAIPRVVWVLVVCHLGLLVGYAVLVPTWRAPDEPDHADMVFAVQRAEGWPMHGERRLSRQVVGSLAWARFEPAGRRTEPPLSARDAVPRRERPGFADIAPDEPAEPTNHMFQHPPLYYALVAGGLTASTALLPGGGWSYDQTVLAMRLVSVLLVAPLPLLCFLVARRLGLRPAVGVAAAAFPLAVPQLSHIGSTVNNDALVIGASAVVTLLLVHVATGDLRLRTGAAVGLTSAVALLAKGLALFLPAMMVAAYAIPARDAGVRRVLAPAATAAVTASLLGGWWWIANLFRYGTVQPTGFALPAPPEGFVPSVGQWLRGVATLLPQRWWGSFGWFQVSLPWAVVWTATALVAIGVIAALVAGPGRASAASPAATPARDAPTSAGVGRPHLGLLLVPLVVILGIVAYGDYGYYVTGGGTSGLQGRYLFPGITGLAVVVAVGWHALAAGRDRMLPLGVLVGAAGLQGLAIVRILLRFYGEPTGSSPLAALEGLLAWAPWGSGVIAALAVATAVAGAFAVVDLARSDAPQRMVPERGG